VGLKDLVNRDHPQAWEVEHIYKTLQESHVCPGISHLQMLGDLISSTREGSNQIIAVDLEYLMGRACLPRETMVWVFITETPCKGLYVRIPSRHIPQSIGKHVLVSPKCFPKPLGIGFLLALSALFSFLTVEWKLRLNF
jgi:hypothetical protein